MARKNVHKAKFEAAEIILHPWNQQGIYSRQKLEYNGGFSSFLMFLFKRKTMSMVQILQGVSGKGGRLR